ncbi:MAG TPA: FxLYD domain-containing protein [Candidatus Binatia bacterium]|nr:FxLYD domain-containing protein [Candidatus Binatia bacterium]
MFAPRGLLTALFTLAIVLAGSAALAQDGFKITFEVDDSRPGRARLNGKVTSERSQDVFEVSVTAEALDARGKVLARGISYVDSRIGRGETRQFAVTVPAVAGTASFRVVVSSFRLGISGPQSP